MQNEIEVEEQEENHPEARVDENDLEKEVVEECD